MFSDPILYILMRSDMASLNPGKAMAQAAHAANKFGVVLEAARNVGTEDLSMFSEWQRQAEGFGTTIVLDAKNGTNIENSIKIAEAVGAYTGIVLDPTYPLRDGDYLHLIPVVTCGWIFGLKEDLGPILDFYSLYR